MVTYNQHSILNSTTDKVEKIVNDILAGKAKYLTKDKRLIDLSKKG